MRSLVGSLVLSSMFVQVGCGDDGGPGGNSDSPTTVPVTMTNPLTTGPTGTTTVDPTDGGASEGVTEAVTEGGSMSATEGNVTTTTESAGTSSSSGEPVTATEPGTETSSTEPGTTSGTTTGDESSTTEPGTSTTTGDESTTTGAEETTEDIPCQVMGATLKPVIPNMMLVLDKSGSMLTQWDHDANINTAKITRWNSLYQTVETITTKFNDKINFGANLFPNKSAQQVYTDKACLVNAAVEIPVKPKNKAAILAGIPAAGNMTIAGGTPAAGGMSAALNHLKTLDPAVPRAVLLVTDGAANCTMGAPLPALFEAYDNNVHTIVNDAWMKDKIPTYVVGIDTINMVSGNAQDGSPDGINPYTKLNELATQGGKPKNDPAEKFYNANNQIELGAALDAIVADALSCVIPLDSEPAKPELTTVKINGVLVPHVMDCTKENGWVYTKPNGPYDEIQLCGTQCASLKMVGKADVNFFCVPN